VAEQVGTDLAVLDRRDENAIAATGERSRRGFPDFVI